MNRLPRLDRAGGPFQRFSQIRPDLLDPLLVGVLAAVVSLAGAGRPSFWFDESATISASASRSLPELARMLRNIDAVHGLYYVLMHGWFAVFPATEFWSRAPSAVAVAIAAAGVVVLAKQFCPRSVAVCAGIVFAVLPRITWAGIEARPYAFSAMAAVWVSVLLVVAARRDRRWLWPLYVVAMLMSIALDAYLVLMIVVHAGFFLAIGWRRSAVTHFAVASVVTLLAAVPFIVFASGQVRQLGWIPPPSWSTVVDVGVKQYFDRSVAFTVLSGLIVGTAIAFRRRDAARPIKGDRQLFVVGAVWIAVPTAIILGYSLFAMPIYYPRYLCFTAPAVALLLGTCIVVVARSPVYIAATLTLLTLAAVPNYVFGQRGPYAKYGMDYSQVADLITAHAAPGDCLLLDDTVTWLPGPIRPLLAARPAAYRDLVDVGLGERATSNNTLWDTNIAPFAVADTISRCTVVWTISQRDPTLPDHDNGVALAPGPRFSQANAFWVPRELGFRLVERWQFNLAQVTKATR